MRDYDIEDAFAAIEEELIASMLRNMKRHHVEEIAEDKQWAMWQAMQLESLERYKKVNQKKFGSRFSDINSRIGEVIREASKHGYMDQETEILKAVQSGFQGYRKMPDTMQAEFFKLNERKLETLIHAVEHDMEKAETAILRRADDQYRKAIFNAQVYANTGAGTYEKAVDMATRDMLSAGLKCVVYANGAMHTLQDYADMALRTASKRAYLQGEGLKRQEWGITTVIVNKRGNPCPKCLPFCGKILIDDVWSGGSKDGISPVTGLKYPLISSAISAGLYHPRCKDSHTTYFEGISTPPDSKYTRKELDQIAEDYRNEQKIQHAKQQVDKYDRLVKHSLDEEDKRRYRGKAIEWRKVLKKLTDKNFSLLLKGMDNTIKERSKEFYRSLLNVEDDDIYQLLQQSYKRVQFKASKKRRSYFSQKDGVVYLVEKADQSTIAHELFHEIDRSYGITKSGMLKKELSSDYARLQSMSDGKFIQDVLYSKYPDMFDESVEGFVVKQEYRGISDIIHGLTGGKVNLGYRHSMEYWRIPGNLQKEAWAQYGRMYYSGDERVLSVLMELLPETTREFERIIKAVMK